jgi:hypothetical protein
LMQLACFMALCITLLLLLILVVITIKVWMCTDEWLSYEVLCNLNVYCLKEIQTDFTKHRVYTEN